MPIRHGKVPFLMLPFGVELVVPTTSIRLDSRGAVADVDCVGFVIFGCVGVFSIHVAASSIQFVIKLTQSLLRLQIQRDCQLLRHDQHGHLVTAADT